MQAIISRINNNLVISPSPNKTISKKCDFKTHDLHVLCECNKRSNTLKTHLNATNMSCYIYT